MISARFSVRYLVDMVTVGWLTVTFCHTTWHIKVVLPLKEESTSVCVSCDGALQGSSRDLKLVSILDWVFAMNAGHLRQLAVCFPLQFADFGGVSRTLIQEAVLWFLPHLTHFEEYSQYVEEYPKPWHWKHWDGPFNLYGLDRNLDRNIK